ncbi:cell adhesion molecule Dscam2-like [Lycorma delicatula]|uniref:cell adhesion molecule Dscam2-like n=1 Tax=Lycorma delicatula TaxID=130591 RepID=UPI003F512196
MYHKIFLAPGSFFCCIGFGQGPVLLQEPPPTVDVSNSTGAMLTCTARGNPPPDIRWIDANDRDVTHIPLLREVLINGSLYIPPFPSSQFRPDVHSTTYRCRASNSVGTVLSRPCKLRPDMQGSYPIRVEDAVVTSGNVAVLQCLGWTGTLLWLYEQPLHGRTVIHSGGRFTTTSTGNLHIRDASIDDSYSRFYCQATNTATGERRISQPAKIILMEPDGQRQPRIEHTISKVTARVGSAVELECSAQAFPPPHYTWFKETDGSLEILQNGGSVLIQPVDSVLRFPRVRYEDKGRYVCTASNMLGEDRRELHLSVVVPLIVQVQPTYQLVDGGSEASFNCTVHGGAGTISRTWLKDGQSLLEDGHVNILEIGEQLLLKGVTKHDRGMYQCFAKSGDETAQATSELALGAIYPELQSTFIEQTMQPGMSTSLKCIASGNPPPRISWLLDGGTLLPRGGYVLGSFLSPAGYVISHLNITNIRVQHGGLYTCLAKNSLGSVVHSASLNVYGPPSPRPAINITSVSEGDVYLRCPVAGFPISSTTWQFNGQPLPSDYKQRVFSNGTLYLSGVNVQDKGEYHCTARNQQNQAANGKIFLNVMKPPEIVPFQFTENLQEGSRAHVVCVIMSGDLPIEITWNKDGRPLTHDADVQEQSMQFVSNLVFTKLNARHAGYYTCVAKNAAAQTNHTARLIIKVPPSWIVEPQDISVLYQHPVTIPCIASGFPTPKIKWTRQKDHQSNEIQMLDMNSRLYVSDNGSLLIQAAETSQGGQYTCYAENGIGTLKKDIYVKVNVPAHFKSRIINQSGVSGEDLVLMCEAEGDLPLRVSWSSAPSMQLPLAHSRHTESGLISEIQIHNFSRKHAGAYHCNANNEFGQDSMVIYLSIKEPPESPQHVEVMEIGSRWLSVRWSPPPGHTTTTQYLVQFQSEMSTTWNNITVNGNTHSAHLSALTPSTVYHLRLLAINDVGSGDPSPIIRAVTLQEAPGKKPQDVTVDAIHPKSLEVTWKFIESGLNKDDVTGFQVSYNELGNPAEIKTVRGNQIMGTTLTGLKQFTRYEVAVRAYNQVGPGPPSDPIIASTVEGVPEEPPQSIQCIPTSSQSLKIQWESPPPEYCNGHIMGYKVFYKNVNPSPGDPVEVEIKKTTNLETTLHGLMKFANYTVRVLAYTGAGEGVHSPAIYCTTDEDVPGPPEQIKALVMTSDSILLAWTRPVKPNGIIIKYTVYIKMPEKEVKEVVFGDNVHIYECRRLKEFQRYDFWVSASTSVGEGEPSKKITKSPMSRVPARIASFSERVMGSAASELSLRCHVVGLPAPTRIWRDPNGVVISGRSKHYRVLEDGTLLLSNLKTELTGNYSCHTENVFGRDQVLYQVVVMTVPDPPVLVVLASTSNSLALQWRVISNGGSHITGYSLSYHHGQSEWLTVELEADRRTYTLTKLLCGTEYELYLKAKNAVGESKSSQYVHTATKGHAPGRADQDDLLNVNSTSAMLFLESWPSRGCPLNHFKITYRAHGDFQWLSLGSEIAPKETVLMSNLQPATRYYLKIEAHSDSGSTVHEYVFVTRSKSGEIISLELIPEQPVSLLSQINIMFPIASGIVCLLAITACIYILFRRRITPTYKTTESSGMKSLMELENQRNDHQCHAYSPSPTRKADSSLSVMKGSDTSGADYEICPYATLNLQTMAHSMQFETFSQRDCYEGQPPRSRDYHYSRGKGKMSLSNSPPDGLNLEISCISSQQTLPMRKKRGVKDDGRTRFNCHCDGSNEKPHQHYTPSHILRNTDSTVFELDSSTESADASPEVKRTRRGLSSRLQPPIEFSDNQELSDLECDRDHSRLELLSYNKFEKQLYSQIKM